MHFENYRGHDDMFKSDSYKNMMYPYKNLAILWLLWSC